MNTAQFRPHGAYSVHAEGRILVVATSGPWNKELIEVFGMEVATLVNQLAGAPWGALGIVTKDGMHTPASYAAVVAGVRIQQSFGRVATAIILKDIEGPALVESILHRMYTEAGETHAFFAEEAEACAWLNAQIAAN